ncbi:hypothetical protein RLOatenuis_0020 [Rickettsiales bacterium]|nr:hypothetical protein RLOatenuis_0020 [Rickettsiales bacterium]
MDNKKEQGQTTGVKSYLPRSNAPQSAREEKEEQDEGYDSLPCPAEESEAGNEAPASPSLHIMQSYASLFSYFLPLGQSAPDPFITTRYIEQRADDDALYCKEKMDCEEDEENLEKIQDCSKQHPHSPLYLAAELDEGNPAVCKILDNIRSLHNSPLPELNGVVKEANFDSTHPIELYIAKPVSIDNNLELEILEEFLTTQDKEFSPSRRG